MQESGEAELRNHQPFIVDPNFTTNPALALEVCGTPTQIL